MKSFKMAKGGRVGKLLYAVQITGSQRNEPINKAIIALDRALVDLEVKGDRQETLKNAQYYPRFIDRNPYLLAGAISLYRYFLSKGKIPSSVSFNTNHAVNEMADKIIKALNRYNNRKRLEGKSAIPGIKIELYTYIIMIDNNARGRK
jgi:hypothetical protein